MSRFFSEKYASLVPYTPGEQPQNRKYLKLNTNESPFPPSPSVKEAVSNQAEKLELYSDPESRKLRKAMADLYGVSEDSVIMTNGSDETLSLAFLAFADEKRELLFPDITYGFYPVLADVCGIPYSTKRVRDDFSVDINDYIGTGKTVVIANPNAPTGLCLPLSDIEKIVSGNPDSVVIIDEAYVDFGGESAYKLTEKYGNLLVIGTFSKSRSMAGARLGFGIASPSLIADMNTLRYSINPYNVNRMTEAAGIAAINEDGYYKDNCKTIIKNREWTENELKKLGFTFTDSKSNFIFAKSDKIGGEELYLKLKEKGVLIRHFSAERIKDYNRITVGTKEQMIKFTETVKEILEGK